MLDSIRFALTLICEFFSRMIVLEVLHVGEADAPSSRT